MDRIARIAVSSVTFSIDQPYDYRVPESMTDKVRPGIRVVVPFGRNNSRREGMVLQMADNTEYKQLKNIDSVLDPEPLLSDEQLKLALWMRERFFCTVYDAIHAMLPTGIWFRGDGKRVTEKMITVASLEVSGEDALEASRLKKLRSPSQSAVLRLLSEIGSAPVRDIREFTGCAPTTVKALEKQGYIRLEQIQVYRRPEVESLPPAEEIRLTAQQQGVFEGLCGLMDASGAEAALLYGVTGSGKTAVYISLIRRAVSQGKGAIVLVPEIALTPQLMRIFSAHFGDTIAVLHSSLSVGERYDEWLRIRRGEVKVVVGTRSAVFAPVQNLGLLILDEEQEHTYKSENAPRYHARDVAKYRCVQSSGLLVLGSATPDVESMYSAQLGKYKLFTLDTRYNQRQLPQVLLADMRQELKNGNGSTISSVLRQELEKNISLGQQSILFLNRRGSSGMVLCPECGTGYTCPNCSVSLTYHSVNRRLMCHYCGHTRPVPEECEECGSKLKYVGAGTQKVEEELKILFPGTEILRMDADTVGQQNAHEKILSRFRKDRIPILIGTQMVAKGLDFENVTLVGVISADQMLYMNDYRAHERAFSLITQVVGRSGRGSKLGRAVIQTFTPSNEVIRLAANQDYMSFYQRDILLRQAMECPPVRDVITVTVTGQDEAGVMRGCARIRTTLLELLSGTENVKILGPAPMPVARVNGRYRYRVTVSCRNTKQVRQAISRTIMLFSNDKTSRSMSCYADVDPQD